MLYYSIADFCSFTQMFPQTTDRGANNGPTAEQLQAIFANAEKPVHLDSSAHRIQCFAHKHNLTVGYGLCVLGQKVCKVKPTIPLRSPLQIPVFEANDGEDSIDIDDAQSDGKDGNGLPDKPGGVDDEDGSMEQYPGDVVCDEDDLVSLALVKVSAFFFIVLSFDISVSFFCSLYIILHLPFYCILNIG